jgi:hypothetical protein
MTKEIKLTRTAAAKLLEQIREAMLSAQPDDNWTTSPLAFRARIERAFEAYGVAPLERCNGEAHSNPHIDNCGVCMPRWGVIGPAVKIT